MIKESIYPEVQYTALMLDLLNLQYAYDLLWLG